VRRAASSAALNVAEGSKRAGKDRAHHYRIAAGSAAEVRTAIAVGAAWGYLDQARYQALEALLDRLGTATATATATETATALKAAAPASTRARARK
jgi:four helix bundle protein